MVGGFNWRPLLSKGLRKFIEKQDPEEVNFVEYPNGWAIEVKTDQENTDDAKEFWEGHVEDKL